MKLQKLVTLVAAVLFLAVTSMAYADNQISVGSNSQPIPYGVDANNCNKGGDLSFQYQPSAVAVAGDAFTMDLDFGTSLCRAVDLWYVLPAGAGGPLDGLNIGNNDIFSWNNATLNNEPMYIHIWGSVGDRRVNVRFIGEDGATNANLTVGNDVDDLFLFRVFNQKPLPGSVGDASGALKAGNGTATTLMNATVFDSLPDADVADNTLCVQHTPSQIAENEKINFNLNRVGTSPSVFEFVGGQGAEPQVGHFISRNYALVSCAKVTDGRIVCGDYSQSGGTCSSFDFETGNGYCSGYAGNRIIIEASPVFDVATDYYFDMKIKVNGNYGDNGVYFTNGVVGTAVASTKDAACAATSTAIVPAGGDYTWYQYGSTTGVTTYPTTTDANSCLPASTKEFVRYVTPYGGLGITGTEQYMFVDLPALRYNLDKISAGDVVSVEIELRRTPCVLVATFEKTIGTMCCEATPDTTATTLTYPYFTNMSGDAWWDGLVVTNLSSIAGTAALSFYEQDGDRGTYTTPSIAAYSMYVSTLENLLPAVTPAVGNTGALGNSRLWIKAETSFSADGFAMMGEPTSGQSMGYLPRVSYKN